MVTGAITVPRAVIQTILYTDLLGITETYHFTSDDDSALSGLI